MYDKALRNTGLGITTNNNVSGNGNDAENQCTVENGILIQPHASLRDLSLRSYTRMRQ